MHICASNNMEKILQVVNTPDDLKKLNKEQKIELAGEIRELLIKTVSETGGHLASNLGVTELTIALHSVYNAPKDKIIWDVGHQTYVHKILTGRKEMLPTLRKQDGLAGFPKTAESEYDSFNTGHSSTSISVGLGMIRAKKLKKEEGEVIAVIGDGALTGGMALEALNDAGTSKTNITIVLNDNEMSISKNVGGMATLLSSLRGRKFYNKTNKGIKNLLSKIPLVGKCSVRAIQKIKRSIKQMLISKMYFEDIGFTYLGPVDGHNIEKLESIFRNRKQIDGPVVIHVITKKGKGYKPAENNPARFHSTSPYNIETGETKKEKKRDYSSVFGEKLVELAKENQKIVAITAAMTDGVGLTKFKQMYSERFFDVGIAEQHALGLAAGLAKEGLIPVVPIYSSFFQRAYDQVIHDICIQKLPVVLCADRAGIVGSDGETHQGIFDLSFFSIVPNLTILAPKDFIELEQMLEFAINFSGPIVIRYPRGEEGNEVFFTHEEIKLGEAEVLKQGDDISIIAIGNMVTKAMQLQKELIQRGISAEVINTRFLEPLDEEKIKESILKTKSVITIEDNVIKGGLATSIEELIVKNKIDDVNFYSFGYPKEFIKQGTVKQIEEKYGLDVKKILERFCNTDFAKFM